ncbi:alpha-1,2-fucosyltransferase [Magnetococcus sp. PR-3]|uniref:alpha-1,2-fucosyltransferase n=1 Tax=Magnetococcus sp. PR-3 TaxID=3120355 RepID=UPI002FCE2DF0
MHQSHPSDRPKQPDHAVMMDVMDDHGQPTWLLPPARGHLHLFIHPNRWFLAQTALAQEISQGQITLIPYLLDHSSFSLTDYVQQAGLTQIDHLRLPAAHACQLFSQDPSPLLGRRMVQCMEILPPLSTEHGQLLQPLWHQQGYHPFHAPSGTLTPLAQESPPQGTLFLMTTRAMAQQQQPHPNGGPPSELLKQHALSPKGVILIGAGDGAIYPPFQQAGFEHALLVEGHGPRYQQLQQRFAHNPQVVTQPAILSQHQERGYWDPQHNRYTAQPGGTPCQATTLPQLMLSNRLQINPYNLLMIQSNGTELDILKGVEANLPHFEAVLVAVHFFGPQATCPQVDDLLEEAGFRRVAEQGNQQGYALYQRRRRIAMSTLGANGRYANQLFQYLALEVMAKAQDAVIETPPWVGEALFNIRNRRPTGKYQLVKDITCMASPLGMMEFLESDMPHLRDFDLWGYFQPHSRELRPHKALFRRIFTPKPSLKQGMDTALEKLFGTEEHTLVTLHLRRGDYGYSYFFITPEAWYLQVLEELWPRLHNPVLFIASDDIEQVIGAFDAYNPKTAEDLGIGVQGVGYFIDYYVQTQADILVTSNSSFSFSAAMLNEVGTIFMRPDPALKKMVPFDPWNADILIREVHEELLTDQRDSSGDIKADPNEA